MAPKQGGIAGASFIALVGMACFSVIFTACFFPLTLMPQAAESSYRLFNQTACVSGAVSALVLAPVIIRGNRVFLNLAGIVGYTSLAVALCTASSVSPDTLPGWAATSGIGCGIGLTVTASLWLGILSSFPERVAMRVLGWQSLIGSVVFVAIACTVEALTNEMSLAMCVVSAMLFMSVHQKISLHYPNLIEDAGAFETGLSVFHRQKAFSRVLLVPALGFFTLVLLYGIIEAVAMGNDGSPYGVLVSYLGAPVGALLFLVILHVSRNRQYAFMIKVIFLVLLVIFWTPLFDVVVLSQSIGFHLSLLLVGSLLIDELSSQQRILVLLAAMGLGVMRLLFLAGLYLPRTLGVPSYSHYESSPLIMFLAYVAFAVFLASAWHERIVQRRALNAIPSDEDAKIDPPDTASRAHGDDEVDPESDIAERLARRYGLTKRESEILDLYARGRDINVVCQTLFLSRNTVKGHAKNLYAKLNVHSKQELINLFENERANASQR